VVRRTKAHEGDVEEIGLLRILDTTHPHFVDHSEVIEVSQVVARELPTYSLRTLQGLRKRADLQGKAKNLEGSMRENSSMATSIHPAIVNVLTSFSTSVYDDDVAAPRPMPSYVGRCTALRTRDRRIPEGFGRSRSCALLEALVV
jgi:hypothetical protein